MVHVWQFRVEVEYYSIAYFNRVTALKVLYLRISVKGRAHMRCIVASISSYIYTVHLSPTLNGSLEKQHFEHSEQM